MKSVIAWFNSPGGLNVGGDVFEFVGGSSFNGLFRGDLTIPRFSTPGDYELVVALTDNAGNKTYVHDADELFGNNFTVSNLSGSDSSAPTLLSVSTPSWSVNVADADVTVSLDLQITDELSGVQSVMAWFNSPSGVDVGGDVFELVSGSSSNGLFRGHLSIPRFSTPGDYELVVALTDNVGNTSYVHDADELFGTNFTVSNLSGSDSIAPTLLSASTPSWSVSVADADATVSLDLQVADDLSGVKSVIAWFNSPSGVNVGGDVFELVSGSFSNGLFRGHLTIPRYSAPGDYELVVALTDNAGNTTYTHDADKLFGSDFAVDNTPSTSEPNRAPVANDDAIEVYGGLAAITPAIFANDVDADGDRLLIANITDVVGGSVMLSDGIFYFLALRPRAPPVSPIASATGIC